MNYKKFLLLLFLISSFLFQSCKKSRIFEKHNDIENHTWQRIGGNHIIGFTVPVKDTVNHFDVKVAIRYMTGFPYTTLHTGILIKTPEGEEKYSMHSLQLRNRDGSYNGEVLGDICDYAYPILKNYRFNKKGDYKIEVENLMSKYETPGIMQIGLIIDRHI